MRGGTGVPPVGRITRAGRRCSGALSVHDRFPHDQEFFRIVGVALSLRLWWVGRAAPPDGPRTDRRRSTGAILGGRLGMVERHYIFPGVIELNVQARRRLGVNIYLIDGG